MPDYSTMSKEDLIVELNNRDAEIVTLNQTITDKDNEISTLNTTIQNKDTEIATLNQTVSDKDAEISTLNQSVTDRDNQIATLNQTVADKDVIIGDKTTEIEGLNGEITTMKTPDGLLTTVNDLVSEDKQDLALKIRTTNEGIKTYFAINYGAEAPEEALIEEE